MNRDREVIKPSKKLYFVGGGIIVAAILLFVVFLVSGIKDTSSTGSRFVVPGSTEIEAEEGTYTIYYEYASTLNGKTYSTQYADVSGLDIVVFDMDNKVELEVLPAKVNSNYSVNSRSGYSVLEFSVVEPATIIIDGRYANVDGTEIVLNVGKGMVSGIIKMVFASLLILFCGLGLGIAIIIIVTIKRSKAISKLKEEEKAEMLRKQKESMPKMWKEYLEVSGLGDHTSYESWAFGSNLTVANELAELVIKGSKTATASVHKLYELENEPIPVIGEHSVILDGHKREKCIIRTNHVKIIPFNEVDEIHAAKEGEGDLTLAYWREVHKEAFSRELSQAGLEFNEDMLIVLEEFEIVYK